MSQRAIIFIKSQSTRARMCKRLKGPRIDNPIWSTGPPGYIVWRNHSLESFSGLPKRLQSRAKDKQTSEKDNEKHAQFKIGLFGLGFWVKISKQNKSDFLVNAW